METKLSIAPVALSEFTTTWRLLERETIPRQRYIYKTLVAFLNAPDQRSAVGRELSASMDTQVSCHPLIHILSDFLKVEIN